MTTAAAEAGFEVHTTRIPDLTGPNLQAKAREFRYGFLELVVKKESADAIATGHTLDDRVETTLARLIHGAGLTGLAGLPAKDRDRVRPLVDLRRSETRAYLEECGIESYDDPANDDDSFERVAVRDRLLSAIEKRWGDGAIRAMTVSADRLRDDADALDSIAERLYGDSAKTSEEGVSFDRGPLVAIPRAFRRRLLERAVGHVRDRSGGIGAALDALDAGLPGPGSPSELRFAVASGIEIVIASDRVIVTGSG